MKMMFWRKDKFLRATLWGRPYNKIFFAGVILFVTILTSCSPISVQTESFFVMDALGTSTIIATSDDLGKELNQNIIQICGEVDGRISKTIETSEIYKLNEYITDNISPYVFELSQETSELLGTALTVQEVTNGAYNPNLGEIIDLWGINNHEENIERTLPQKNTFFAALENAQNCKYDIDYLSIAGEGRVKFDLGAIGKGYALDCVNDYLESESMQNALVSFSSSILALGRNKSGELWSIGIKDPVNPDIISGVISANDKFVSVSAGYERFITINGIDYCHIIDPETGYPVDNDLLCVVVIMEAKSVSTPKGQREKLANNGALSDALSTALYVMGKQKALDFYANNPFNFEMILYIKSESDPRGYEILQTNVNFNEKK